MDDAHARAESVVRDSAEHAARTPLPATGAGAVLHRALVAAAALAVAAIAGRALGVSLAPGVLAALFVGAVLVSCLPTHAYLVAGLTGVAVLYQWGALRTSAYHLTLVLGTFFLRGRPPLLVGFLVLGVIVVPKELFQRFYHHPFLHDWVNPFLLAHLFLVVLVWWSTQRRGRANEHGVFAWLCLLLFPSHPINPLPFSPGDLWRPRLAGARDVAVTAALLASKAGALAFIAWALPHGQLAERAPGELMASAPGPLWRAVLTSYLVCALSLSASADLAVLIARLFGWKLGHSFRWALLAWNPVELWRRWAIYNRKVLLSLVYFPLGGGDRRRTLNVMLTFAASGLVLHSGWLGSRYWETGVAGWRDQTLYFLLQGVAVCGCLWFWQWRGKSPSQDRELRLSWGRIAGTVGTQLLSAWLHIIVLAPNLSLADRLRLMARCLGF